jgi:hypothetical protein
MFRLPISLVLILLATACLADESLKGIACRSVHLGYKAEPGTAFYIETTVTESAPGTYFCALGFNSGYFGIQELANGKKVVIFSVWDPTKGDDPKKVDAEKRVKQLHKEDDVRVGRFGGEGTGGQSLYDFDWKVGETYRFLVTAEPDPKDDKRVAFAGYFYLPEKKTWKHLVTFSTLTDKKNLSGYYSFVEDFRRNKLSTKEPRRAEYGNAWVRSLKAEWISITEAHFTADANPVLNIDAGLTAKSERYFLATGGDTENKTTKLRESITATASTERPADLPVK